jgi:hypothetical protein
VLPEDMDMEEEEDGDIESEAVPRRRQLRLGEAQAILRDSASKPCHLTSLTRER